MGMPRNGGERNSNGPMAVAHGGPMAVVDQGTPGGAQGVGVSENEVYHPYPDVL